MAITIDQANVVAVLLPTGWHPITPGSFRLDKLAFNPVPPTVQGASKPDDDYGFSFVDGQTTPATIHCRISALLGVRQTSTPTPTQLPAP